MIIRASERSRTGPNCQEIDRQDQVVLASKKTGGTPDVSLPTILNRPDQVQAQ
jgi:hypothetical protein